VEPVLFSRDYCHFLGHSSAQSGFY
ncbi:LOW QUALITY PROTEIN: hypothetical protein TorRG33x02_108710, partial [Trema orientale]